MEGDAKSYFHLSGGEGGVEIPVIAKQLEELLPESGTAGQTAGWIGFFQACLQSFSLFVCAFYFLITFTVSFPL